MAGTFQLEVATPERLLLQEHVTEAQIPAENGMIGVLPEHAPLLSMLGTGPLTFTNADGRKMLFVSGGTLQILHNHVRVLADRAEAAAWRAGLYNTCFLGVVGAVFLLFAPTVIGFFTGDPEVARHGVHCLRILAAGFLFYGYAMVLTAAFNGAGDTRTPTLIFLLCFWAWEIPLAWVLAQPLGFGPTGVFDVARQRPRSAPPGQMSLF